MEERGFEAVFALPVNNDSHGRAQDVWVSLECATLVGSGRLGRSWLTEDAAVVMATVIKGSVFGGERLQFWLEPFPGWETGINVK